MTDDTPPSHPTVSVVIPVYNEADRLPETLARLYEALSRREGGWEVLVSDDGSEDGTLHRVDEAALNWNGMVSLRTVRASVNLGKGAAVRRGCLAARGERVVYTDADLAVPVEDILRVVDALDDADVAVGTRERGDGSDERASQPPARRMMGRLFSFVQRLIVPTRQRDTQCPVKAFRRSAAHQVFAYSRINGWAFDVEVLHLAQRKGLRVAELPVRWQHREGSRLRPSLRTVWQVFRDLVRIRLSH